MTFICQHAIILQWMEYDVMKKAPRHCYYVNSINEALYRPYVLLIKAVRTYILNYYFELHCSLFAEMLGKCILLYNVL